MYYHFGRITQLLLDYDPVVLEDAGNPLSDPDFVYDVTDKWDEYDDDSEIYYQDKVEPKSFDVKKATADLKHPLVKDTIIPTTATPVKNQDVWLAIAGSATAQAFLVE